MEKISTNGAINGLPVINPHAAGIDVGSIEMVISYTNASGQQCVCKTGAFTQDLKELVEVLLQDGVTDVAMEATGEYWKSLYEMLEDAGINMTVINPSHYKNSANLKTDENDSQWIHQYHSCGILRHSHIATESYRELRSYLHERSVVQNQKSETLSRIQRLLTVMNIKLQHYVSDIEGSGAMKVLRAIASGVQDAPTLVNLMHVERFKAGRENLEASLEGNYKPHLVTLLRMKLEEYDFFVSQMKKYEGCIEAVLQRIEASVILPEAEPEIKKKHKYTRKNQYGIDIKGHLEHILGIDLTAVEGFDEKVLLDILSITGADMGKWPTAQHFVSWLNLSPRRQKTGGKYIGNQTRRTGNPATQALRMSAQSIGAKSKGPLGILYRRLSATKGSKTAIKAVARKLGILFYTLVKNRAAYDFQMAAERVKKQTDREVRRLHKMARKLGYDVKKIA
jgi:transposase